MKLLVVENIHISIRMCIKKVVVFFRTRCYCPETSAGMIYESSFACTFSLRLHNPEISLSPEQFRLHLKDMNCIKPRTSCCSCSSRHSFHTISFSIQDGEKLKIAAITRANKIFSKASLNAQTGNTTATGSR